MINGNNYTVYMIKYKRLLDLRKLLKKKSHFLFGARATGKSTLISDQLPGAMVWDLLDEDIYQRLLRNPKLLGESLLDPKQVIVVDEIQRLPKLLNEVQRLMKEHSNSFLLTGSSARKIKRGGANLLGGRAWESHLHPLTFQEISDFDLIKYLNRGGLPHVYLSDYPKEEIKHYINLYIREEIVAEALTRNIEYFISFIDTLALGNGEELYFQGLASDSGVPARTIQNYVQILEDTLLGFQLRPYIKTKKRKAISRSKFYFFDLGIVNHLANRGEIKEKSNLFGKAFEHFIIRELKTRLSYLGQGDELSYWRSTSQFEVDLIIGDKLAIEIKSSDKISKKHLKGLKALREEGLIESYYLVSLDKIDRTVDGVRLIYWETFLKDLLKLI